MRINRRIWQFTTVVVACSAMLVQVSWARTTAAKSGVPPYCVLTFGARGMALPQICRFYDYQQCLQAAADLHGNCVVNIDYPGVVPMTSPPWAEPRR